tara:strand:- start:6888 stop:7136 length:249 start_codon:yes stop_codon:yes gene_type:complete
MMTHEDRGFPHPIEDYRAVALAEGFETADSLTEQIHAWQHLVDTGLAWKLQGSFGRGAATLIEQGVILPADVPGRTPGIEED